MESAAQLDCNYDLSLQDLPYIIRWREDRCTRCGRCTAVCPVKAIEPTVRVRRVVRSEGANPTPTVSKATKQVVSQVLDIERYCTGCGTCSMTCPTEAITPEFNPRHRFLFFKNKGGSPYKRGGRRNDPGASTVDQLKFTRISMLTDPALDAGRHEFRIRTLLGRNLPAEQLPVRVKDGKLSRIEHEFVPPVREIFPIRIGGMSIGALSPHMWDGMAMGVTYLNEVVGLPVVICTGEGGIPPSLLKSRFAKYVILQIASGIEYAFEIQAAQATGYVLILGAVTTLFIVSACTGLGAGIRILSNLNTGVALLLMAFILLAGPTLFILKIFVDTLGQYLWQLPALSFQIAPFTPDYETWMGKWTLTYFTWWIAWAPCRG